MNFPNSVFIVSPQDKTPAMILHIEFFKKSMKLRNVSEKWGGGESPAFKAAALLKKGLGIAKTLVLVEPTSGPIRAQAATS